MTYIPPMLGFLTLAVACWVAVHGIRTGWLKPNSVMGIRTQHTRKSEQAWKQGHRAAYPFFMTGGIVSITCAGALGAMMAASLPDMLLDVVTLAGYFSVLVLIVGAGMAANKRARNI
ncbi:SdpI family protein [Jonesia quinghaiensis]|uniref:SdpI family protein n=1 Tax=Jonesia quinghaiensis TaxID=262806 RepID=UPI000685A8CE|nr:SdpI family protein [Jonesia quinghaiensis]